MVACGPRSVENPAANAPTYSEEEYVRENLEIFQAKQAEKIGVALRIDFTGIVGGDFGYEVFIPEKKESTDSMSAYLEAIKAEINRIDAFLKKYDGKFRIRYKDGDLKVMSLTETGLKNLKHLRVAWVEALDKVEREEDLK
jgi:hypothetical protein